MLKAPGVMGHPSRLSQRHQQISSSIFLADPLPPLQLSFNLQEFKTTWHDKQDLYINPDGHFSKQTPMSKWPLYLECGFMQETGQQSSCPLSS